MGNIAAIYSYLQPKQKLKHSAPSPHHPFLSTEQEVITCWGSVDLVPSQQ